MDNPKTFEAWAMSWTEREAGWGQRDDGISVHASLEIANKYAKEHAGGSYECYWRADGDPERVFVTEAVWEKMQANGGSLHRDSFNIGAAGSRSRGLSVQGTKLLDLAPEEEKKYTAPEELDLTITLAGEERATVLRATAGSDVTTEAFVQKLLTEALSSIPAEKGKNTK